MSDELPLMLGGVREVTGVKQIIARNIPLSSSDIFRSTKVNGSTLDRPVV